MASLVVCALLVAGCGGDDGEEPEPASIDEAERCMKDAGLDARRTLGGGAQIGVIQVPVPEEENSITVTFFENEDAAKDNEEGLNEYQDELGGEVKRRRTVVYWSSRDGAEEEFQKVEDCL